MTSNIFYSDSKHVFNRNIESEEGWWMGERLHEVY